LFFRGCSECPEPTDLENALDVFTDNAIENITFKKWISTVKVKLSRYMPWRHMGGEDV
jgi:hypothetical protein